MTVRANKLVAGALLAALLYGLVVWLEPIAVDESRPARPTQTPTGVPPVAMVAPPHELGTDTDLSIPAGAPVAPALPVGEDKAELDYSVEIRGENLPPEVLRLMQSAFVEFGQGNVEYAAMLGQEALALSDSYPVVKPTLYGMIGYSYENLGYVDLAIQQYRLALALYPLQRTSYDGMRRLDPEFAATHPELPVVFPGNPENKPEPTQ